MKHILETKHAEEGFKCAIIVNDMAALNIDKSLIDQSALVQSDKVIEMQNGCFCCTLQIDLVDQIISLTKKNIFNYMLIEASGVSEPSQIAPLFVLCDDEDDPDDPEHDHQGPQLGEMARLDTCVTVVDSIYIYIPVIGRTISKYKVSFKHHLLDLVGLYASYYYYYIIIYIYNIMFQFLNGQMNLYFF